MRALLFLAFTFTLGAFAMSQQAVADDKKKEELWPAVKRDTSKKESYDERVTVRQWDGKKFISPVENVPAYKSNVGGKNVVYTRPTASNDKATVSSEITFADGSVYVVQKVEEGRLLYMSYVTKKDR
jgi:hypothetical protein